MSTAVPTSTPGAAAAVVATPTVQAATSATAQLVELVHFFISTCLAYGVVFGASILKVPQLVKLWRSHSAAGVSLLANEVELFAYVISTSWGIVQRMNFRDYGENIFIFVQLLLLVSTIAGYQRKLRQASVVVSCELVALLAFLSGIVPVDLHRRLLGMQIVINICSRVPQIMLNMRNRGTGELSFITFFLAFGGCVARVLTTLLNVKWEHGKAMLFAQYTIAASLNFAILAQMVYYSLRKRRHRKHSHVTTRATYL